MLDGKIVNGATNLLNRKTDVHRRIFLLIVFTSLVAVATILISISILYRAAFQEHEILLSQTARSQGKLIEVMVRTVAQYKPEGEIGDAQIAILDEILNSGLEIEGFGETGEIAIGERQGDQIVLLHYHEGNAGEYLAPVDFHSKLAEPMRRALSGESGTIVGFDYDDIRVLAAYEYLESLDLGIVAKKDFVELLNPFLWAGVWTVGGALVISFLGVLFIMQVSNPLIRNLETTLSRLQNLAANLPGAILQLKSCPNGSITIPYASEGVLKLYGFEPHQIQKDPQPMFAATHPDDRELMKETMAKSIRKLEPFEIAWRKIVNGNTKWIEGYFRPNEANNKGEILWDGIVLDVTQRKKAEEALRQAHGELEKKVRDTEDWLSALINTSKDAMITIDNESRVTLFNPAAEEMFGHSQEEMMGQELTRLMPEGFQTKHIKAAAAYFKKKTSGKNIGQTIELSGRRGDGKDFPLEMTLSTSKFKGRRMVMGIIRDISERKKAETDLKESELRYRALFENCPISFWEEDFSEVKKYLDGLKMDGVSDFRNYFKNQPEAIAHCAGLVKIIDVNQTAIDQLKADSKAHLIEGLEKTFTPDSLVLFAEELIAFIEGKTSFESEIAGRTMTGETLFFLTSVSIAPGCKDSWSMVIISSIDITKRVEIEQERRLKSSALEAAANGIVLTDRKGSIVWANPAFTDITGYSMEECLGETPRILKSGKHDAKFYKNLWQTILKGDVWQGELINKRKDGSLYTEEMTITPVQNEKGEIIHFIAVKLDVSDRKEAEEALKQAKEEAELASKAKSSFLANMSHELRTPMNGVLGMADILLDTDLNSSQKESAEIILTSGKRLLNLLNDILDFSKIESGNLEIVEESFSLRKSTEETFDLFASAIAKKNINLNYLILDGVPNRIFGDPIRIQQVLLNLIGNAVKFTEDGDIFLKVSKHNGKGEKSPTRITADEEELLSPTEIERESSTEAYQYRLLFEISDSGIGIPEDRQKIIFEEFTQADVSTTKKFGGTGLGLTISRKLVEMMGGSIWLKSVAGEGTTFYFTLEIKKTLSPEEEEKEATIVSAGAFKDLSVLIVDDNPINQKVLEYHFTRWEVENQTAGDGFEALSKLKEGQKFDLCILDWAMPGMDGLELALKIQELKLAESPKLVIFSSVNQLLKPEEKEKYGIAAELQKPLKVLALKKILANLSSRTTEAVVKEQSVPVGEVGSKGSGFEKLRVLLVEDNLINQKVALNHLKKLGVKADVAKNGKIATAKASETIYDVIFMDVQMPVMDGYEATRCIREMENLSQQPKIVGLTAFAMKGDREKCLKAGMNNYISKPFQREDLRKVLDEYTSSV